MNWFMAVSIMLVSGLTIDGIAKQQATGKTLGQTIVSTGERVNECSKISLNASISRVENSF